MRIRAVIEIPKGDNRRRHLDKYNKSVFVDLGPMKDHIPVNNGVVPEHYGFIPDTLNADDGDEIDILVLSDTQRGVGETIEVEPIALLKREDKDQKVIAVEIGSLVRSWEDLEESRRDLVLRFYGSHHKITNVGDKIEAEQYIRDSSIEK